MYEIMKDLDDWGQISGISRTRFLPHRERMLMEKGENRTDADRMRKIHAASALHPFIRNSFIIPVKLAKIQIHLLSFFPTCKLIPGLRPIYTRNVPVLIIPQLATVDPGFYIHSY